MKMNGIKLDDILEKRNQILNKNDEYLDIPDDDTDDVSTTEIKNPKMYSVGKSMEDLTETIKKYLDEERTRKVNWVIGSTVLSFFGISGLIVLNDYILLNYFV